MSHEDISFANVSKWLKLKHLELIDTLARTRNMHATAELMNLSQPAISKALRDIELLLGFTLFDRQTRNMALTELGEYVTRFARATLYDTEFFVDQINKLRKGGHGHLRVGSIFGATSVVLPEAIAQIKQQRPMLSIEVSEQTSNQLLEMLEHKKLDLIIARFTDERYQQPFDFQPLAPEPFCLVASSEHPLCAFDEVATCALSDWPWVMYPFNTPIRRRMDIAFSAFNIPSPVNTVETISMQTFLQLLQSGPMLAMLPESMVHTQVQSGLLKILQSPFKVEPQEYGIITRKDEVLSEAARTFVDILLTFARQRSDITMFDLGKSPLNGPI